MSIWDVYRPDAASALDSPGVLSALSRYVDVVRGRKKARYLLSRLVPSDYSDSSSAEELWAEHTRCLAKEEEMRISLDHGRSGNDRITQPTRSLLHLKHAIGERMLQTCSLCEHRCRVNRASGQLGYCRVGGGMLTASCFVHLGEEPEIVPSYTVCDRWSAELAWAATSGVSTARTGA